jgi:hypothetical protein
METQLLRIVNAGTVGEPERIVLQNTQTNTMYEFSQIVGENITNGELSHPTIQRIVNNGFTVDASIDDDSNVTLHF